MRASALSETRRAPGSTLVTATLSDATRASAMRVTIYLYISVSTVYLRVCILETPSKII